MDCCSNNSRKSGKMPDFKNCGEVEILLWRKKMNPATSSYIDLMPVLVQKKIIEYASLENQMILAKDEKFRDMVFGLRTKHMCYTDVLIDNMYQADKHAQGSFGPNYVQWHDFSTIIEEHGRNLLQNLKFLHLVDADFKFLDRNRMNFLADQISSFRQLEELKIVRSNYRKEFSNGSKQAVKYLNLTLEHNNLKKFHIENAIHGVQILILRTPNLTSLVVKGSQNTKLQIEKPGITTIEKLTITSLRDLISRTQVDPRTAVDLTEFQNLKYLYILNSEKIDEEPEFLEHLLRLTEIHLQSPQTVRSVLRTIQNPDFARFNEYQRGPTVYYHGLRIDNVDDEILAIEPSEFNGVINEDILQRLVDLEDNANENDTRLATQIPLYHTIRFTEEIDIDIDKWPKFSRRLIDLETIEIDNGGKGQENLLKILEKSPNIKSLDFSGSLADVSRLFEKSCKVDKIQKLSIQRNNGQTTSEIGKLNFLSKFSNLISLELIDMFVETQLDEIKNFIQKIFNQHPFLVHFRADYNSSSNKEQITIEVKVPNICKKPKEYKCSISANEGKEIVSEKSDKLIPLIETLTSELENCRNKCNYSF